MRTGGFSSKVSNRMIGWIETAKIYSQITKKIGFFYLIKKVSNNILKNYFGVKLRFILKNTKFENSDPNNN